MSKIKKGILSLIVGAFLTILVNFISPATTMTEAVMATKQLGNTSDYMTFQFAQTALQWYYRIAYITIIAFYAHGSYFVVRGIKEKNQTKNENE